MSNNQINHHATLVHAALTAGSLVSLTFRPLAAATLHCPPRLPGPHAGFEQIGPVPTAHWLLWRLQLFNLPPGENRPAELPPAPAAVRQDGFTLTWHLAGSGDVQMLCLYDGSATYYRARLHPPPATCTLQNNNGLAQGWCEIP
jgi:hypothetical protein